MDPEGLIARKAGSLIQSTPQYQFTAGVVDSGVETVVGVKDLVTTNPVDTINNIYNAGKNYKQTYNAIKDEYVGKTKSIRGIGSLFGEAAQFVLTGGVGKAALKGTTTLATKGSKIAKVSKLAPKNKSWKLKIHGTAQKTGTPGHQFRTYREAIAEAKKSNVTSVHLDHGYNRGLGLNPKTIQPNRRPDVLSVYDNKSVARIEVQSSSDVPAILRSRNAALDAQLRNQGFNPLPPRVVQTTRR